MESLPVEVGGEGLCCCSVGAAPETAASASETSLEVLCVRRRGGGDGSSDCMDVVCSGGGSRREGGSGRERAGGIAWLCKTAEDPRTEASREMAMGEVEPRSRGMAAREAAVGMAVKRLVDVLRWTHAAMNWLYIKALSVSPCVGYSRQGWDKG